MSSKCFMAFLANDTEEALIKTKIDSFEKLDLSCLKFGPALI
jgi:hypothetical protein